jgi:phosphohistidine phosphatase
MGNVLDSMELYLVQHAEAKSKEEDPERSLTNNGKEEANLVAAHSAKITEVHRIMHSPKLRARQTADIFAGHNHASSSEEEGLKPLDDPEIAKKLIESQESNLMLVGHLPHLNRLSSLLLSENSEADVVSFRKSAVVCLEKTDSWRVKWILTPELARL